MLETTPKFRPKIFKGLEKRHILEDGQKGHKSYQNSEGSDDTKLEIVKV